MTTDESETEEEIDLWIPLIEAKQKIGTRCVHVPAKKLDSHEHLTGLHTAGRAADATAPHPPYTPRQKNVTNFM